MIPGNFQLVFDVKKRRLVKIVTDSKHDEMGEEYENTLYAYEKLDVLCRHLNKEYVRVTSASRSPSWVSCPRRKAGKRKLDG